MKAKLTERYVANLRAAEKAYEARDTELNGFLVRVQPTGRKTFYVDYRLPGEGRTRYRIDTYGKITATAARSVATRRLADVAHGTNIQAAKKQARKDRDKARLSTLKGFLDARYGPWVKAERKTGESTLKRLESNFGHLLGRPLTDINLWVVEKWRAEQRKAGKQPSTINRDVGALKTVLSKAVEWEVLGSNPLRQLKPVRTDSNGPVRYLSKEEEGRLREALDSREQRLRADRKRGNQWRGERGYPLYADLQDLHFADYLKPMVLLSLNMGLRRGELFDLTWKDVNFGGSTVTVQGATSKTAKTRHVPLNDEALEVLKKWHKQSEGEDYVFPGKHGGRMDNVRKSWASVLERAKIVDFRWHDMRHHFASCLVMAGVDLNTVRELLGHGDITMTLRYAHLAPEHKAEAVRKLADRR